tara:strand:+ start:730 stop:1053 length:324 start_codon:yes stop_codon:yes gene_type:complete
MPKKKINERKPIRVSKLMLVEIKKMPNVLQSHMAYFYRPKSFMAMCELCTRLKKHQSYKKNKGVLNCASLHDKKKWAKLVKSFPKRYPNHSKVDGTLIKNKKWVRGT